MKPSRIFFLWSGNKVKRRKVYSKGIDYTWSAHLIELNNDKGYKYDLTIRFEE